MKRLTYLWQLTLKDLGVRCCTSTFRDSKRVTDRVEHEGVSFLTITLPKFGSDFEKSLDRGFVAHDLFTGFRFRGGLPEFLGGFLELVFDHDSGRLLSDPDVASIFAVRQLTRLFSKILLECSDARREAAIEGYLTVEKELKGHDHARRRELSNIQVEEDSLRRVFALLWADSCTAVDNSIATYSGIRPKHGPGATADGLMGNQKFVQSEWTDRLEDVFPFGEYALPSWKYFHPNWVESSCTRAGDLRTSGRRVNYLDPGQERPVKVTLVPKTLKTPRIIAIEPTCMQYMQQAIAEMLVEQLQTYRKGRDTSCFIGFRLQEPNQLMAQIGSQSGDLATLDLSEASDRVSNSLVRSLLRQWPHLGDGVDACRSRSAKVPGRSKIIRLAKFASMGSALTFPIEAMIFTSVVFLGIEKSLNRPLTRRDIQSLRGRVRVYGDDIVCPVENVQSVIHSLEAFGFKVNVDKSFWNGKFRESCGKEYYDGHDVSVVKCRRLLPSSRRDAQGVISTVSFRNQCYMAGLWGTARYLDDVLSKLLGHFPDVGKDSPVLGRHSYLEQYQVDKMSEHTHSPLVRGYVEDVRIPPNSVENEHALLKFFLKRGLEPFADRNHLTHSGRPKSTNIKLRWSTPY